MPDSAITWEAIAAAIGFLITIAGFALVVWKYVEGKVDKARSDALLKAEAVNIKVESLERDVAAYKTHVAETFATKAGLTESLGRVHDALDRLTERIDKLIAAAGGRGG